MTPILTIIILLTGFEPFNKEKINSSWEAVKDFTDKTVLSSSGKSQAKVITHQLPCVFDRVNAELIKKIEEINPTIVVAVGQRGEISQGKFNLEKKAINRDNATKYPDNDNKWPDDEPIDKNQPRDNTYLSTLPIKEIKEALDKKEIPVLISDNAGSFVCNHTFYGLMDYIEKTKNSNLGGGFVHVPCLPTQRSDNNMPLTTIIEGLEVIIKALLIEVEREKIKPEL